MIAGAGSSLMALGYALFCVSVIMYELHRTRTRYPDSITIFVVLFLLQCGLSGVVIFALLPVVGSDSPTGVAVFDRILANLDLVTALLVLCLSIAFVMSFYFGCALGRAALPGARKAPLLHSVELKMRLGVLLLILAAGLALTLYSFWSMGDNIVGRFGELVLYRGLESNVERNAINANAFALTQTWAWLSVVALFAIIGHKRWRWALPFCVGALIVFALLGVSRRALFLPLLLAYLAVVLHDGRWHARWIAVFALPILLVVAFGKNALSALAYGGTVDSVVTTYESWPGALLRAAADIGITIIESAGTVLFLDDGVRWGADHLLSLVKLMPEQMLGFHIEYPERIVRISTEAFAGADAQDIPPGLFGQMWLDFRIFGPVIWGLTFGLIMSVVQFLFESVKKTFVACAVTAVVTFVVALPLNTGSFDFTFSVDIVALCMVLVLCVTFQRWRCA